MLTLDRPTAEAIADAYRELPRLGGLAFTCPLGDLAAALTACEQAGFIALRIAGEDGRDLAVRVTALKGKAGACYETGRSATLTDRLAGAVDDDNHVICGTLRVCEKTGALYQQAAYHGLITVTDADPALLARLATAPQPFDCDTLQRDAAALAERLRAAVPQGAPETVGLYRGPFRFVILPDGALLRRGSPLRLTAAQAAILRDLDALLPLPPGSAAALAPSFPALHAARGPACLLAEAEAPRPVVMEHRADPTAVDRISPAMRGRLVTLLSRNDPYFILTGSDPRDAFGCCPNETVGEALRLVEAGVLMAYRQPAPPDACTTTIFALPGEIRDEGGRPAFTPDPAARQTLAARLGAPTGPAPAATAGDTAATSTSPPLGLRAFLRAALLAVAGFGVVVALLRMISGGPPPAGDDLAALVRSGPGDHLLITVLRGTTERCTACETMKTVAADLLINRFADLHAADRLRVVETDVSGPQHRELRRRYGVFGTSTIVLAELRDGRWVREQVLTNEVWGTIHDRGQFSRTLETAIVRFVEGR